MATVDNTSIDKNGNKNIDITLNNNDDNITLATANTYVDKNIIINVPLSQKANIDSPEFIGTPTAPTTQRGIYDNSIATTEFVNNEFEKVVKWDNAEEGTTVTVTTNMVVLTEEEYESLTTKIPNTFYFIYDNEGAVVTNDL